MWQRWITRLLSLSLWLVVLAAIGFAVWHEQRHSTLQARFFSDYAKKISFKLEPGANDNIIFPSTGPYDNRLGYTRLPQFIASLQGQGYQISAQAKPSEGLINFVNFGGFAIYPEKSSAGLSLFDRHGEPLYSSAYPSRVFANSAEVPALVAQTLLFIENRELLDTKTPQRNPAIEWDRFVLAAIGQGLQKINPSINLGGGSTLATQIEKFRHSPGGQTNGSADKLRQMLSASMRAYADGPDTMKARQRIVLDYLNSTPLTARAGLGEINGLGDGLWAWFGSDLRHVRFLLSHQPQDEPTKQRRAMAYKQVLALLLAQRRPSHYLLQNRVALEDLANTHLQLLFNAGIIDAELRDLAMGVKLQFREQSPAAEPVSYIEAKATNAIRNELLGLLSLSSLYELDRLDLSVGTTLDLPTQARVVNVLEQLGQPEFAIANGLTGFRLLKEDNDFSRIIYSFVLYERTKAGNVLRVQADNLDQPLDINSGAKLDLGSTAKLRTLITYLEIIAEIYDRYRLLDNAGLSGLAENAPDTLSRWVAAQLRQNPQQDLKAILAAAMQRQYSASPREQFFTGGGLHSFGNFEKNDDYKTVSMQEAFRHSINLPFIRLMRDVVNYLIAQGPLSKREVLADADHPARLQYLARFADREGGVFLSRFYHDYRRLPPTQQVYRLLERARKSLAAQTVVFRSLYPQRNFAAYTAFIRQYNQQEQSNQALQRAFNTYAPGRYNLADRGYIAGLHPLELWLVQYLLQQPETTLAQALAASSSERQTTYDWLFSTRAKGAQDTRIRILLEQDAFAAMHARWARLGYPFERLVPSLATSIGSSADRPAALAELMGIILNDGQRLGSLRVDYLDFAKGTPYQTTLTRQASGIQQVMRPEIAKSLQASLLDIVDNGTARRLKGTYKSADGIILPVGGKTGTGDHRYEEFGAGGRLISSRVVSRTATFVFYLGDKFYGTITAHIRGPEAAQYSFTSGLPVQLLKSLQPALQPLINSAIPTIVQAPEQPVAPASTQPKSAAAHPVKTRTN